MPKYREPRGVIDFIFAGPKTMKRYNRDNDDYRRAWHRERARRDYRS